MVANFKKARVRVRTWIDAFWGYDVFIAHRRSDAAEYARRLDEALQAEPKRIASFVDRKVYGPGDSLTVETKRNAAKSDLLVLVGSPELTNLRTPDDWVEQEVKAYLESHVSDRKVIPIDFGGTIANGPSSTGNRILLQVKNFLRVAEPLSALVEPPSEAVLGAIRAKLDGRRRDRRRVHFFAVTASVLAVLLVLAVVLGYIAWTQQKASLANETRALAALSDTAAKQGKPVDAVELALAAWPRKGDDRRPQTKSDITALNVALSEDHERIRFAEHSGAVRSVFFSPDGMRVVTASDDKTARIWDARTGASLSNLLGHEKAVRSAAFSPDGKLIVTASDDGTACIWDAKSGTKLHCLKDEDEDNGIVYDAVFSPDGKRVVAAYDDKKVRIWNASTYGLVRKWAAHGNVVYSAVYSPDGKRIVTASRDKTARIWDAQTRKLNRVLRGHTDEINYAAYSPDGNGIVTASEDGSVRIWDAYTGEERMKVPYSEPVHAAVFSQDGKLFVTASYDGVATLWDAKTGGKLLELKGHDQVVNFAAFSPDGTRVVTASDDKTARIWDTDAPIVFSHKHKWVNSAAFSPDGTHVVTACRDTKVRIWDADTGERRPPIQLTGGGDNNPNVYFAAYSPDGSRIVTASEDSMARIWDAQTGALLHPPLKHESEVASAVFSPDSKRIVTASDDGTACIWDAESGTKLRCLKDEDEDDDAVHYSAFSPDGTRVVAAYENGKARIWDANTGTRLNELGHSEIVYSAVFSPDGTSIVTASGDHTVRIWDAKTGKQLSMLPAHHEIIYSVNFSKDGKRIVTASEDGTARVWDVSTGVNLSVLSGHTKPVFTAEFSRDDAHIVTASQDGTARVWNNSPIPDPFAAACARIDTIGVDLKRLFADLAARYGLTGLKPICGVNAPKKIDLDNIQE
jgi:WD40 repeat protein